MLLLTLLLQTSSFFVVSTMSTSRVLPSKNSRLSQRSLEESWEQMVNDDSDDPADLIPEDIRPSPRNIPKDRFIRSSDLLRDSPEPELIMPSLSDGTLSIPRTGSLKRTSLPKTTRASEKSQEPRRRTRGLGRNLPSPSSDTESSTSRRSSYHSPDFFETTMNQLGAVFSWILSVIGQSLKILKTPIAYGLAIWMLLTIGITTRNFVTNSIYASFSPLCSVPGISLLGLPFCSVIPVGTPGGPPEFEQLMTVQSKFEDVLETTAGGASLPLDMKRGEASIRDLRQLVKFSQLYSK